MPKTVLLTGFGPFPGAPFNPAGPLVERLARGRHAHLRWRRVGHVFATDYGAVDRELPQLIARERPDIMLMFGLALRTRHLRIEVVTRNRLSSLFPDVSGYLPQAEIILPGGPPLLALPAPVARLLAATRSARVPSVLSHDAGSYLCNYLCWRACEAAAQPRGPKFVAFVHVPKVPRVPRTKRGRSGRPILFDDLARAGEAILVALATAASIAR